MLSELRVFAAETQEITDEHRVSLKHAQADFAQAQFPSTAAIDGKDQTGWAIVPETGRDHWIMVIAEKPIRGDKTPWLRLVLSQNHGQQHTIGRFRVMAITGSDPAIDIPQGIREILAHTIDTRTNEQAATLLDYFASQDKAAKELTEQIARLHERAAARPIMKVRAISERIDNPRKSHVLHRGDFLQPEGEVHPAGLAILPTLKPRASGAADRLDLARWLCGPANPLTPRVMTNHLWSNLFGRGIVRTVSDFGIRGERPTHPELLDWLATELMRRGWSRKELIRLVVTSATYRQASATRQELTEVDPLNDLLHRQNRYRVEGEIVRDLALSASGLLSGRIGGPSVFPPLPPDIAELSYAGNFKWTNSTGDDRYRRGMYTFFKRTAPHPNLTTFDCPDANTTTVRRQTSNTNNA